MSKQPLQMPGSMENHVPICSSISVSD